MLGPFVNPATRDYVLSNGNIENKNAILTLSYMRLRCPRGSWIYNTDFGNPLLVNLLGSTDLNRKTLQQQVRVALQDMVTLGYVKDLVVITTRIVVSERRVEFLITMIDNLNEKITFPWSMVV